MGTCNIYLIFKVRSQKLEKGFVAVYITLSIDMGFLGHAQAEPWSEGVLHLLNNVRADETGKAVDERKGRDNAKAVEGF
jgi:hypothetical protein